MYFAVLISNNDCTQGVVLTPLDFAEASSAFNAMQEIQSAGGVFGRQLQEAPREDWLKSIKEEEEIQNVDESVASDLEVKREEVFKPAMSCIEEITTDQGDSETTTDEHAVENKQEKETDMQELNRKETIEDSKKSENSRDIEAEVMHRQPDGEEDEEVKQTKEELRDPHVSTRTKLDKEEMQSKIEREDNLDEPKERGITEQTETTILGEETEEKEYGKKEKDLRTTEANINGCHIHESNISPDRDNTLDDTEQVEGAAACEEESRLLTEDEVVQPAVIEDTKAVVEDIETRDIETYDRDDNKRRVQDVTVHTVMPDSLASLSVTQAFAQPTMVAADTVDQTLTESDTKPNHLLPTLTPSKQMQQFKWKHSDTPTVSSKQKHAKSTVATGCAYGGLLAGVSVGAAPQKKHIVQQLVTVLPYLKNISLEIGNDESTELQRLESAPADNRAEIQEFVKSEEADTAPDSLMLKETVGPSAALSYLKAVENETKTKAMETELAKDDQPMQHNEDICVAEEGRSTAVTHTVNNIQDDNVMIDISTVGSDEKRGRAVQKSDLLAIDEKEAVFVDDAELKKQSLATDKQPDLATETQATVPRIQNAPDPEIKLVESVVVDASKTVSHQPADHILPTQNPPALASPLISATLVGYDAGETLHSALPTADFQTSELHFSPTASSAAVIPLMGHHVSEKSPGSLIEAVRAQIDQRVADGGNTVAQEEQEAQQTCDTDEQRHDLLSDEEKKLIETLRMKQERPTSAAARAMKELARVHVEAVFFLC